ncbi:MAG: class I SAM-dependent methyltransferase [Phycisphaeraceae bacterium]
MRKVATAEHTDTDYAYWHARGNPSHKYLLPAVMETLQSLGGPPMRVFDVGCGNGSTASQLAAAGYEVSGVDPSESGIERANQACPNLQLSCGSAYDDLAAEHGRFPVVLSLEVVEHLYSPHLLAQTLFDLLEPGGTAILSTPYHGYLKNLALAATGKLDKHFSSLREHGHIKFFSVRTLEKLLTNAGFVNIRFMRLGRIAPLAKSMVAIAEKPVSGFKRNE